LFPNLFTLGPFTLHTYGLLIALGALLGVQVTIFLAKKEGFNSPQISESLYQLLLYLSIGGILGGRLAYVLLFWNEFSSNPLALFKVWEGGLVFYGGFIGALLSYPLWQRKNKNLLWRKVADWVAPALAFGHALGRLGCFAAGCCYGIPTRKPWGVIFKNLNSLAPLHHSLHPTQIYEFLYLIFLGGFLLFRSHQKNKGKTLKDGTIFAEYLLLYSLGRFIIEFFRADIPLLWSLTPGHVLSALLFIFSLTFRINLARN